VIGDIGLTRLARDEPPVKKKKKKDPMKVMTSSKSIQKLLSGGKKITT